MDVRKLPNGSAAICSQSPRRHGIIQERAAALYATAAAAIVGASASATNTAFPVSGCIN